MARFEINHPLPGNTVFSNFLVAQGNGDPAILNIIGIIWDPSGMVVDVGMATANPPHWLIVFEDFEPGCGYCLEVIDANTRQRLACSGPFDAQEDTARGPAIYFPGNNASFSRNGAAYGYYAANTVKGKTTKGVASSPWVNASTGPTNWIISFSNLPLDATHTTTMRVEDTGDPTSFTNANNLSIF